MVLNFKLIEAHQDEDSTNEGGVCGTVEEGEVVDESDTIIAVRGVRDKVAFVVCRNQGPALKEDNRRKSDH